jgi:hypothetical protein
MVCDDKWHSVVRVLFFILDEVFSVNTTCFDKTMVNARIVVTPTKYTKQSDKELNTSLNDNIFVPPRDFINV